LQVNVPATGERTVALRAVKRTDGGQIYVRLLGDEILRWHKF